MNFNEWIQAQPDTFPLLGIEGRTPFQNPIIGDDSRCTYFNIREIVILIKELIEPYEGTQPEMFSLSQPALWGLIRLLDCANGALAFEEQFRLDQGFRFNQRDDDSKAANDREKSTESPPAAPPAYTHHVFHHLPDGEEKYLGEVQASSGELALAKARKKYADLIQPGDWIILKDKPLDPET